MLLIDAHSEGITKTPLKKMGWWASDTAHLHFDQVQYLHQIYLAKKMPVLKLL